jgi:hypothetical protein
MRCARGAVIFFKESDVHLPQPQQQSSYLLYKQVESPYEKNNYFIFYRLFSPRFLVSLQQGEFKNTIKLHINKSI